MDLQIHIRIDPKMYVTFFLMTELTEISLESLKEKFNNKCVLIEDY